MTIYLKILERYNDLHIVAFGANENDNEGIVNLYLQQCHTEWGKTRAWLGENVYLLILCSVAYISVIIIGTRKTLCSWQHGILYIISL